MFSRKKTARENFVELLKQAEEFRRLARPVSLEQLAKRYSSRLDEMIRRAEKEESFRYGGGEFLITCRGEDSFTITINLYFQNLQKEWVRMQSASGALSMRYLTEEARKELAANKEVGFDIDAPLPDVDAKTATDTGMESR